MTTTSEAPHASVPPERPVYKQIGFWIEFLAGFIGWYWVNGLVWSKMPVSGPGPVILYNIFVLPVNLVVLIIAAFIRRRFAGGILAAIGLNIMIAVIMGAFLNAGCAIPFFVPVH